MPRRKNNKKTVEEDDDKPEVAEDAPQLKTVEAEEAADAEVPEQPTPAPEILYCEICSLPPEYCEFGSSLSKCKKWLEEAHPDLWARYYSDDALSAKASALTLEQASKLNAEAKKKESKANQKAKAEEEKRKEMKIVIKRVERTKRKHVTIIQGLEGFCIDLKAASKLFAQKFATGASVSKATPGSSSTEEIVIQGDVAYDVEEMFEEASEKGKSGGLFASIDVDAVEIIEGKK